MIIKYLINSFVVGEVWMLNEVNDEMFVSGVMGKGIVVILIEGVVIVFMDGVVLVVFDISYVIGFYLDNDVDLLIYVGIDIVELKG